MIQIQCQQCGKEFKTWIAWTKRGQRFCSKSCFGVWQSRTRRGKNHPQYKESAHSRMCAKCGKEFEPHNRRSKYCSYTCKGQFLRGENHPKFKKEATYSVVHWWLAYHYGKANKCENFYCPKTSTTFEWALLKGKKSERVKENYWQLCKRCHLIYDRILYPVSKTKLE